MTMKKLIRFTFLLSAVLSCSSENDDKVSESCHLSAVTASNSPTSGFVIENGKLVGTTYDGVRAEAIYTYDANGNLTKIEAGTAAWLYFYDSGHRIIRYEVHNAGVLDSKGEYT